MKAILYNSALCKETDLSAPLKLILDKRRVAAQPGDDVILRCPSNVPNNVHGQRPSCRWLSPAGKTYTLVGNYGEVHDYPEDGIELPLDTDRGDCAIRINDVDYKFDGIWKCTVLRPSFVGLGSDAASADIKLEVSRAPAKLIENTLQGFRPYDRNVQINMQFEILETQKQIYLYWIIQRKFIVHEGQTYCPIDSHRCYKSSRRRDIGSNLYSIDLFFDELTPDDVSEPLVLIKDYLDSRDREDYIDVIYVPKTTAEDFSEDWSRTTEPTERFRDRERLRNLHTGAEARLSSRKDEDNAGCTFGKEFYYIGESMDFPDLCVRLTCKEKGSVELSQLMDESSCRSSARREKLRRNRVRSFKISDSDLNDKKIEEFADTGMIS